MAGWIKADSPASLRALIGKGVLTWGSKRDTVRDYVEDLAWAGLVEVNEKEDIVIWVGKSG